MLYRNNLKNRFLASSGLPQNFRSHSRLASRQWSLAPNENSEDLSCQIPDSPGYFDIWLFFKVKWFLYREKKKVHRLFPAFLPFDRAFKKAYRFRNPFHLCKQQQSVYGETPIPIFAQIARACSIHSEDIVFEVGCGRGRGAMFLSHLCKCKVVGIDWVSFFIRTAKAIVANVDPLLQVSFLCQDLHSVDYSGATVIYLYGTCLSDSQIFSLVSLFAKLPLRTKIVTVSYPLSDYSSHFRVTHQFTGQFPWGLGEIFINEGIL